MTDIRPYKIHVSDEKIQQLKDKLAATILPDELPNSGWDLGSPLKDVKRLAAYWKDSYDWRKTEAELNKLPQYMTAVDVDGFGPIDLHFVHQPSPISNAIPLIFVHGWPGSYIEVTKLLPLLAAGDGISRPAFHVVAPSLPNFGFSGGVNKRGFDLSKYAEAMDRLMVKLGYEQYVTQGGDWGYMITRTMGLLYPERVKASHINLARPPQPKFKSNPWVALKHALTPYTELDKKLLARSKWFATEGRGYNMEQSTKPQTLGYALADSPVALLAWIYEKQVDWTDNYPWTEDEVCTWISIYWFNDPWKSIRIYYEASHPTTDASIGRARAGEYISGPVLGVARSPRELDGAPAVFHETMAPKVYMSAHDKGGHFAATENPEAIAHDLFTMMGKGGIAYGVVAGRSGYQRFSSKL